MQHLLEQINYSELNHANIFELICDIGFYVRQNNLDGLECYQPIKSFFQYHCDIIYLSPQFQNFVNNLNYRVDNQDSEHLDASLLIDDIWIHNRDGNASHYLIQLFRIPKMSDFKLPVAKFAQIAYNVGQLKACLENYPPQIQKFVHENHLLQYSTYVN